MNVVNKLQCALGLLILISFISFAGISVAAVPGPEYTDQTMECQFTPELTALAAALGHDPVSIFKWVYENIDAPKPMFIDGNSVKFRPFYTKSRLGAQSTYLSGHGNHWDTSSLLITLLRISGIPARYARFEGADFVWAEAWIKHSNYRNGSGDDISGQWIPMVPWFKEYHTAPGLDLFPGSQLPPGLEFDFNAYLLTDTPKHAAELYEEKFQEYLSVHHPGQTLETIGYKETVKEYESTILAPTLPACMRFGSTISSFAQVPASEQESITFTFRKYGDDTALLSYTAVMPQVSGKRICLDFKNVSGALKPTIKVDGIVVQGGGTSDPGLQASDRFYISYIGGGYANRVNRPAMDAGTFVHIGLDPVAASPATIARLKEEYSTIDPTLISDPDNREQLLGRMGKIVSDTFLSRNFQITERIDRLVHGRTVWSALAPTFIFTDPSGMDPDQESKFWFHPQWNIDAQSASGYFKRQGDQLEPMDWEDPVYKLARWLSGYASSFNEGMVFDDWQDTPSASTIKILMVANEDPNIDVEHMTSADIPMLEALKSDYGVVGNALHPSTIDYMIARLNQGGQVTAPLRKVTYKGMTGYVMLVNNPDGSIGDSYLFNMFEGGKTSDAVIPSVTTVPTTAFHDTSPVISSGAQQTVTDTYVNSENNTTTASNNSWLSAVLSAAGDPVNMATGEFYHEELPDIIIPSRGLNLSVVRTYKSQLIYNGPFGYGWTWNHGEHMVPQANGDLIYYDADSTPQTLVHNLDNTYQTAPGVTYTVRKDGTDYKLKFRNNTAFVFNADGFLTRKQDAHGNYLLFGYDTAHPHRLVTISDALGQRLTLTYNGNGKVERLEDVTGRFCTYTYDGDDLAGFTDLGNNITSFTYLKNQSDPQNNHNLTRYTLPMGDYLDIGYYENDQVSFHRNKNGDTFNFFYSTLNRYGETWNEEGYYRKVFFNENNDEIRVLFEDSTIIQKAYDAFHNMTRLTDANGQVTTFDFGADPSKRLLASSTDSLGNTTNLVYNDPNNPYSPSQITDPKNHVTRLAYYPSGRVHTKTTGVGFAYGADQRLVSTPGAPGFTTTYEYDAYGNLTRIMDPTGNASVHTYGANGLYKTSFSDRNDHVTRFTYYLAGEGSPVGLLKSKTIISPLYPSGITTAFEYNPYSQVTLVTDANGDQTSQGYDNNRKPTLTTQPNGAVIEKVYDFARDLVTGAKVKEIIDPLGNSTLFTHDRLGNILSTTDTQGYTSYAAYNGRSRLTSRTDALGQTAYVEYDGNGNILSSTDNRGNATLYEYDAKGRPVKAIDPEGHATQTTWDANGNKESIIDPNLVVTQFTYDALNRVESKTTGFGTPEARTVGYRYDELNRLVKEITPQGNYKAFQYDPKGNVLLTVFYDRSDQELRRIENSYYPDPRDLLQTTIVDHGKDGSESGTIREYDKLGRKIAGIDEAGNTVSYEYDAVGNLISTSTPLGITENDYDLANRLVTTITPLGEETHYQYDKKGNLIWTRDQDGNETHIAYDALGRKTGNLDPLNKTVLYDYDPNANLLAVTDQENRTTYYKYDRANRKTRTTRSMGQETRFAYDNVGNLEALINGEGHKTAYTYNSLNQPLQVAYYNNADLITPVKTVRFGYDPNGNMTGYDDAVTSATYSYDDLGRKTVTTVDFGPFTKTYANAYPDNWTQTFTGPDNQTATFAYDPAGRLVTADHEIAGQVRYSDYLWDMVQTKTLPGTTVNYAYDLNGRVAAITAKDSLAATLLDRQYTLSPKGDLQTLDAEHGSYAYTHDELSRLIGINAPPGLDNEGYTYDGVGNRITSLATAGPWQYKQNNELTGQDATSYTHDDNGSITYKTGSQPLRFQYDETGRLTQILDGSSTTIATYYYDPFGQRLWKEVDGAKTYYLYAEQGLIAEYDNAGIEIQSYGYLPGTANSVAPLYTKENGQYYWYHNDHIGTPQQLVDDTGTITWEARYTGFGKASLETQTITNHLRLPGQYYDAETGLHYNGNRYYDPDTGRYLRTDPLGLGGGLNLYVYALNSPLMFTDPDGLVARDPHNWLAGAGLAPGLGIVPDIADTLLYLAEGDYKNAGMSGLAAIPILGQASRGAQYAAKYGDEVVDVAKNVYKNTDEVIGAGQSTKRLTTNVITDPTRLLPAPKSTDEFVDVYRVYGGKAKPDGFSWTDVDPSTVKTYRDAAGLPDVNTGRFVVEGTAKKTAIIKTRDALPLDGNKGGLNEFIIDPKNVVKKRVSGVNPEF
ncbi:MAG: RHS domain-containing protein [Desulfobacterium sp.]|nr:RHS domain-containing protein [Desulfobacterium sp.]